MIVPSCVSYNYLDSLISFIILLQVPSFTKWLKIASELYDFFLRDEEDDFEDDEDEASEAKKRMTYFDSLQNALDLDMRFSEA